MRTDLLNMKKSASISIMVNQYSALTECERSMLRSPSWYSVFGRMKLTSVLTMPVILDGHILFVSLYSERNNSLFDPIW